MIRLTFLYIFIDKIIMSQVDYRPTKFTAMGDPKNVGSKFRFIVFYTMYKNHTKNLVFHTNVPKKFRKRCQTFLMSYCAELLLWRAGPVVSYDDRSSVLTWCSVLVTFVALQTDERMGNGHCMRLSTC